MKYMPFFKEVIEDMKIKNIRQTMYGLKCQVKETENCENSVECT